MLAFRMEDSALNNDFFKYFRIRIENYNYNYTSQTTTQNPIFSVEPCTIQHFVNMTEE